MSDRRIRMRPDTFNLLVAAGVLILVALLSVLAWSACRTSEEDMSANGMTSPSPTSITYHLTEVREGPLVMPSSHAPWRREEVAAVFGELVSATPLTGREVPYLQAKPCIYTRSEALVALTQLAVDMPAAAGVKLQLDEGYRPWEEAGEAAGTDPAHTGYGLHISFALEGEGSLSPTAAMEHPVAAAPAAWLSANLTSYGFIYLDRGDPGEIYYVGYPHAAVMQAEGWDTDAYLSHMRMFTQASPYVCRTTDGTLHIFYVQAEYGSAQVTVSEQAVLHAAGDGADGFLVVLYMRE